MDEPIFENQDLFIKKMLEDYDNGNFHNSNIFKPYMDWKNDRINSFPLQESQMIRDEVQRQLSLFYDKYPSAGKYANFNSHSPWGEYEGYGEDKYMVSYLEAIDSELIYIQQILS